MPREVEFWFDISCPYAYLGSTQLESLAARTGATIHPRPFLLGGVFRALDVPQNLTGTLSPAKARHNALDLNRHARAFGIPYQMPAEHPRRSVEALRCLLVVPESDLLPLAHDFYRAYWVDGEDIADREVLGRILRARGHDAQDVLARIESDTVKADLRNRTEEAVDKGIFGAPGFIVDGELYWGMDRLPMVERALGREPVSPFPDLAPEKLRPIELWFDYSSPFAYLGVNTAMAQIGPAIRLRPMLLGAVFKAVEQVNVPMSTFSESKRRAYFKDIHRQAELGGLGFSFPTRFPMNTVNALRMTLAAGAQGEMWPLARRIYQAFWVEDRDISDKRELAALGDEAGLDGEGLIEMTSMPDIKQALFTATEAAVSEGVFGAPTFVVTRPDGQKSLYWGSDRLPMAAQAAAGHAAVY